MYSHVSASYYVVPTCQRQHQRHHQCQDHDHPASTNTDIEISDTMKNVKTAMVTDKIENSTSLVKKANVTIETKAPSNMR